MRGLLLQLDIGWSHWDKFQKQEIRRPADLFMLTPEDMNELELPIGSRNRLLAF